MLSRNTALLSIVIVCLMPLLSSKVFAGGNLLRNSGTGLVESKWDERMMPIRWSISSDGYPNPDSQISNEQIYDAMQSAFDSWESITTSAITFEYSGFVDTNTATLDGINLVTFTDSDVEFPPSVAGLALTYSFFNETTITEENSDLNGDGIPDIPLGTYPAGTIYDGNIIFKTELDYTIDDSTSKIDLEAVALHEVGHFIGLSHSSIQEASMFPTSSARVPSEDDIAYASRFYPSDLFDSTYGEISGTVIHGKTDKPILGAHVFTLDPDTGKKHVGAYTDDTGSYSIPSKSGRYYVGIEPLDGDPEYLDPERINLLIADTLDTNFIEEFFDANESSLEIDASAALPLDVSAGLVLENIDLQTNVVSRSGVSRVLYPGINYFSFPINVPDDLYAFDLLALLGDDSEINSIDRLNSTTGQYERASYFDGNASGVNFIIRENEGYLVHAKSLKVVTFDGSKLCVNIDLDVGLNLIGVACPSASFSAFDLLQAGGGQFFMRSVKRYDPDTASVLEASFINGEPSGEDFPIVRGEAYLVEVLADRENISVNGSDGLLAPSIAGISPGRAVRGALVTIIGQGFGDLSNTVVSFNGVDAQIVSATASQINVVVPNEATSGLVTVTVGNKTSSGVAFVVDEPIVSEEEFQLGGSNDSLLVEGQILTGSVSDVGEEDRYTFIAMEGDYVTISANALSADLDLAIAIEAIGGVVLTTAENNGSSSPLIHNFRISNTGKYTLVVSSDDGLATGSYDFTLDIIHYEAESKISVLSGSAQTAVAGSDLFEPFEVYVSGEYGKPLANTPITITATNLSLPVQPDTSSLQQAGTTVIKTNANGIAIVEASAPDAVGNYEVVVSVPGLNPVVIEVSTIGEPIGNILVSKQFTDCGGEGCTVGEVVDESYSIQYLSAEGNPIENVYTQWKVIAGDGSISDFLPEENIDNSGHHLSGVDGKASVNHTLGTTLYSRISEDGFAQKMPQAVVAFVSGQPDPILFTAESAAGAPVTLESSRSAYGRQTFSTFGLNGVVVQVKDEYGNPVENATVDVESDQLRVSPGLLDGVYFSDFQTNALGYWAGLIDSTNAVPTIDEFGGKDSEGLSAVHAVKLTVDGISPLNYAFDVDMGPTHASNLSGFTQFITREFDGFSIFVNRFQRIDGDDGDEDWSNEDFDPDNIESVDIDDVPVQLTIRHSNEDLFEGTSANPPLVNDAKEVTLPTENGRVNFSVAMGDIPGTLYLDSDILNPITIQFDNPEASFVEFPLSSYGGLLSSFVAVSPDVEVVINASDFSGIDWNSLLVSFNDTIDLFGGDASSFDLNTFPNYIRIYLNGSLLTEWPTEELLAAGGFEQLRIEYTPTGLDLIEGINSIKITANTENGTTEQFEKESTFVFNENTLDLTWATELSLDEETPTQVASLSLNRTYSEDELIIDSYREIGVVLQNESIVSVELLDGDLESVKPLVTDTVLSAGPYRFILLREDLDGTGIVPRSGEDFHISVVTTPVDPSVGDALVTVYRGELITTLGSKQLGQVIQHDTLIQRGTLHLQREDLSLRGAGPQLNFNRTYTNAVREENKGSDLGTGWTHNHNIFLKVLTYSNGQPFYGNRLPSWISQTRGDDASASPIKMLSLSEYETITSGAVAPSVVHVSNGGTFTFDTTANVWVPQRGFHGRLEQIDVVNEEGDVTGVSWVYVSKDGTRYQFEHDSYNDQRHYIERIEDRNGNALQYSYYRPATFTDLRRVDTVTDQSGRVLDFQYDKIDGHIRLGKVVAYASSNKNTVLGAPIEFEYFTAEQAITSDITGMLKTFTRDDFEEQYQYEQVAADSRPNMNSLTDSRGWLTSYVYYPFSLSNADDVNRVSQLQAYVPGISPTDLVHQVCYPTSLSSNRCNTDTAEFIYETSTENKRTVIDPRGNATHYVLNATGNPIRIEEPESKITEFVWSSDLDEPDNVMREKHDASIDAKWLYEYDAQGNLTKETDPYGKTTIQEWNQEYSVLLSRTDKNGHEFTQILDDNGNVRFENRKARVDGVDTTIVTEHTYGNSGFFKGMHLTTTDARSKTTTFEYDGIGQLDKIIAPYNTVTRYVNDARGLRTDEYDANDNHTQYVYDDLERLGLVTDALGNTVDYEYDANGNKTLEESTNTYLVGSDIYTRTLSHRYTYDSRNRVDLIVRSGNVAGALADESYKISGVKRFVYDGNSNVLSETDWKQQATTHQYDGLNRKLNTTDRNAKLMEYSYDFIDQKGLRKTITDYEKRVSVEHNDLLGRLVKIDHPEVTNINGETKQYVREIAYDNLENITSVIDENGHKTQYVYDARYLKVEQIDALENSYIWHYDEVGNQIGTVDEEQRITRYKYDDLNRLEEKNAPEGHNWFYEYYDNGTLQNETDPWGFVYSYTYNGINQRTSVTHPDGVEQESYTHDGQLVYKSDAEGRTHTNIIGPENRLYQQIDAVGRTTTNTFDDNNNVVKRIASWADAETGPASVTTQYVYDTLDRLKELHEAKDTSIERVTRYTYDDVGNLRFEIQPEDRITETVFDELNRAKRIINAEVDDLNRNLDQLFDGVGNLVGVINRDGSTRSMVYDELNRQEEMTNEFGNLTSFTYDKVGNLRTQTDMRNVITETLYDDLNRVTEVYVDGRTADSDVQNKTRFRLSLNEYDTKIGAQERQNAVNDANGNRVLNDIDWRGNVLVTTLPAGENFASATIVNEYDNSGFLKSSTDASGFPTVYDYFEDGTVKTITNAEGETTTYAYDLFSNQVSVIKPKGLSYEQRSNYDARNRLASVTDANGNITRFEYDVNNNLRHQYQPAANDSGEEVHVEYVYDNLNRKRQHIQHKASSNLVTEFDYNEWGLLTQKREPEGNGYTNTYINDLIETVTYTGDILLSEQVYTYDKNKNVTSVTENGDAISESNSLTYDLLNRLVSDNQRQAHLVSYTYDSNGNRLSVTSPGGLTTHTYDTRNRLKATTAGGLTTNYSYYQNAWQKEVEHGNGSSVIYTYDDVGRTETIINTREDGTVLSSFEYTYDDNGNRTQQIETQDGFTTNKAVTTDYVYDILDRLESYTHTTGSNTETHGFTYYPSYDRKTQTVTKNDVIALDQTYTYDDTYWLTNIADAVSGGTVDYTYDKNGNTKTKFDSIGDGPTSTLFTYNARNESATVSSGELGSEVLQVTNQYNFTGMRTRQIGSERGDVEYIYDDQSIIDEVVNNTTTQLAHYRYGDRLLSLNSNDGEQFYHYATLGTTSNLTNASGENQIAYRVDPFGKITEQEGESVNRQVFTGQEHDEKTGLIYFGARFYDPDSVRFINQDSYLGESNTPPSLHRYLYAYSNPNVYVDFNGNEATPWLHYYVDKNTDVWNTRGQTYDTGSDFKDSINATNDTVGNAFKYVGNSVMQGLAIPTYAWQKTKSLTTGKKVRFKQAENDLLSLGPINPVSARVSLSQGLRHLAGSTRNTATQLNRTMRKSKKEISPTVTVENPAGLDPAGTMRNSAGRLVDAKTKKFVKDPNASSSDRILSSDLHDEKVFRKARSEAIKKNPFCENCNAPNAKQGDHVFAKGEGADILNNADISLAQKRKIADSVKEEVNSTISNLCGGKGGCNPAKGKKRASLDPNDKNAFIVNENATDSFKGNVRKAEKIRQNIFDAIDEASE